MQLQKLQRYATRPGFFYTDDGGADVVVRSETAEQLWLSVLEPVDKPSAFYNQAVRLPDDAADRLLDYMRHYPICSRIVPALGLRETLFKMTGPNYGLWNLHLEKAWDGLQYGFRADGTWDPHHGLRFNPYKFLIDPYAKGIERAMQLDPSMFAYQCTIGDDGKVEGDCWGEMSTLDSLGHCPVSVAIDDRDARKHDGDPEHPHVQWSKTVIYELHVKGFTKNAPWLPEELRGTYAGLAHPTTLAYLQDLGVTSIELLPIMAKQPEVFLQERGRTNYWGYSTLNFFSPEPGYATKAAQQAGAAAVRREVIDMVRALHEAGFEVIMDVVYNHTCEGGNAGPSVCWRGLDNLSFYRQQTQHAGELEDTTGCGNTVDFTDTHNITFAVDSLRYWAKRIGIDGFRFDLAVSLARLKGMFTPYHPFLYALRSDQLLGNLKLIMEPWDLGFQGWRTGQFLSPFGEWNDRFRDASRQFWLSDINQTAGHGVTTMQEMATRLCGSADLFATDPGRGATSSINYISAHDGFTLADLTSYDHKHNEANGENNNDGTNVNHSANFGVEGPTDDLSIESARERSRMNMLGTLILSLGTPMLLAGDEFGNTQYGNNNAYCQDNEITWLDWDWINCTEETAESRQLEATANLIAVRKSLDIYNHEDFFTRLSQLGLLKPSSRVQWSLPDGTMPMDSDWRDSSVRSFMMHLYFKDEPDVLIVVNGDETDRQMHLPSDSTFNLLWSSAQTTGEQPAPGTSVTKISRSAVVSPLAETLRFKRATSPMHDLDAHGAVGADAEENAARQEIGTTKPTAKLTAHETQLLESILDRKIKDILDQQMPPMTAGAHSGTGDPTRISMADSDPTTTAFDVEHDAPAPEGTTASADAPNAPPSNVWTFPALSISLLLQSERRTW